MQTFDMWIWYRLMVSDEREITLRLNFSHLFLGEEKEAKKKYRLSSAISTEENLRQGWEK